MPKPTTPAQRLGLAYQRKVGKRLKILAGLIGAHLESEPWFSFIDSLGQGQAVPDFLFHLDDLTLIIEVKLTWVPEAQVKLSQLYLPIIVKALTPYRTQTVVICRNLTPETRSQYIISNLRDAQISPSVLHWLGRGAIPW